MMNCAVVATEETKEVEVFDKTLWLDKLSLVLSKLEKLQELADNKETKHLVDKHELYETSQLYKMINTMVLCDQHDINFDNPVKVNRLIKVNRYIPNPILDYHRTDRIIAGGMFTVLPIWILPADAVDKSRKNRWGAILEPEKFGLPSFEEAKYSTLKELDNNHYMVLAKGTWFDEWILSSRHMEYVMMDL